jgi:hypothetical protein
VKLFALIVVGWMVTFSDLQRRCLIKLVGEVHRHRAARSVNVVLGPYAECADFERLSGASSQWFALVHGQSSALYQEAAETSQAHRVGRIRVDTASRVPPLLFVYRVIGALVCCRTVLSIRTLRIQVSCIFRRAARLRQDLKNVLE